MYRTTRFESQFGRVVPRLRFSNCPNCDLDFEFVPIHSMEDWNCPGCDCDLENWYSLSEVAWCGQSDPWDFLYNPIKDHIISADMVCCDKLYRECTCETKLSGDMIAQFVRSHTLFEDVYDQDFSADLSNFDCGACDLYGTYMCVPLRNYAKHILLKGETPKYILTPCKYFEPNVDTIVSFGITVPKEFQQR